MSRATHIVHRDRSTFTAFCSRRPLQEPRRWLRRRGRPLQELTFLYHPAPHVFAQAQHLPSQWVRPRTGACDPTAEHGRSADDACAPTQYDLGSPRTLWDT